MPVLPDGVYTLFLAPDGRFGIFGHPWEMTVCVFGRELTCVTWPSTQTLPSRWIQSPILRATVRTGHGFSAVLASVSKDGGLTWASPRTIIANNEPTLQFFNDKESVTANPIKAGVAYAVWDRLELPNGNPYANLHTAAFRGIVAVSALGQTVRVLLDVVLVGKSRAEISLDATAPAATTGVVSAAERRLARRLATRVHT